jgi:hypothetical protein
MWFRPSVIADHGCVWRRFVLTVNFEADYLARMIILPVAVAAPNVSEKLTIATVSAHH